MIGLDDFALKFGCGTNKAASMLFVEPAKTTKAADKNISSGVRMELCGKVLSIGEIF